MPDQNDAQWMQRALQLGRRGCGLTRPNPPVGAVVVRDGRVVGEGYHRRAGRPHAEVFAIRAAGARARGATLYVTLEPCSTRGRTPACTDLIRGSGIARVVVSVRDPNPAHAGAGLRILRRAGIAVQEGVHAEEGESLIAPFRKHVISGLPYLTLKIGMTLDGRIADRAGRSRWITCAQSRRRVTALRRSVDAIMVGSGTAVADDPGLLSGRALRHQPYRVIVDAKGALPRNARVLSDGFESRTVIAATGRCGGERIGAYRGAGADVLVLGRGPRVNLSALMAELGRREIMHVLCEGGGQLAAALMEARLVDELLFFIAPSLLGGGGVAAVAGEGWPLDRMPRLRFAEVARSGRDAVVRAWPVWKET